MLQNVGNEARERIIDFRNGPFIGARPPLVASLLAPFSKASEVPLDSLLHFLLLSARVSGAKFRRSSNSPCIVLLRESKHSSKDPSKVMHSMYLAI